MRRGPRHLTPEEIRLWRRVVARDKPLRPGTDSTDFEHAFDEAPERLPHEPAAAPKPRDLAKAGDKTSPTRAHDFGQERRVRRGQVDIQGRIDLHGFTQRAAEAALKDYVEGARRQKKRAILVITGKGAPEKTWPETARGVLRRRLPDWLDAMARQGMIAGFAPAHRRHGGEGAFYVFLKAADFQ